MSKRLLFLLAGVCLVASAAIADEAKIQGIPVHGNVAEAVKRNILHDVAPHSESFEFSDIVNWVGKGENEAACCLQWNVAGEENALVWGYRWNGEATGMDMLSAIAREDKRVYLLLANTQYGVTVAGIGYDRDGDGEMAFVYDGEEYAVDGDNCYYMTISDYDNWTAKDPDDYFSCGMMTNGYWSYYVSDEGELPPTGYAMTGASDRILQDGCVDGWSFMSLTETYDWKPLKAATATVALPENFEDGFFIVNEGWLGHDNGSINWIASDGTPYYNVDAKANNGGVVLGTTSQYATIYGENMYVMSKQAPRLVVMDAQTLEVRKSFDEINGGDGRAILGVDENKIYVGSSAGIYVLDPATFALSETAIAGTDGTGQVGMMARVGKYVFATKQKIGVLVIDAVTDEVVETIENADIYGLTVTKDGTVWAGAKGSLVRINPVTFEAEVLPMPNSLVSPWGTWMPDKLCAAVDENALFYAYGTGSWSNSETSVSKLLIDEDGQISTDPDFNFTMPAGNDDSKYQFSYGGIGVDPHTGMLVVLATQSGYGANYSYNWVHMVNTSTGAVENTIVMKNDEGEDYYWFPAIPVFPDVDMPEIVLNDIIVKEEGSVKFDMDEIVKDADNRVAYIEVTSDDDDLFSVACDGLGFEITPVGDGMGSLTVKANSNGRVVEKTVTVDVSLSSVSANMVDAIKVYPTIVDDVLTISGLDDDAVVTVYGLSGTVVAEQAECNGTLDISSLVQGSYIVKVKSGEIEKIEKIIKK